MVRGRSSALDEKGAKATSVFITRASVRLVKT